MLIKGPLLPVRDLRVCQGPHEKPGQGRRWEEGRVRGTGRSGLPLQGGCLGGDTPVNLSGRSSRCADVSMCVRVCVFECV